MWNSFGEDQLVAASQSTQSSFVCKNTHYDTGNITFVTSAALHVRWLLHSALHFKSFNLLHREKKTVNLEQEAHLSDLSDSLTSCI